VRDGLATREGLGCATVDRATPPPRDQVERGHWVGRDGGAGLVDAVVAGGGVPFAGIGAGASETLRRWCRAFADVGTGSSETRSAVLVRWLISIPP